MADPGPDHHIVINGKRWRATDPEIPDTVAAELRKHLMQARRDVGAALRGQDAAAERDARRRVQIAKVALGERGTPWWEQSAAERKKRWEEGLEALACPSCGAMTRFGSPARQAAALLRSTAARQRAARGRPGWTVAVQLDEPGGERPGLAPT